MVFEWLRRSADTSPPIARKADRKYASDEWVKQGEDLANEDRTREAIDCFVKAIEINPGNAFAWGDKALMLDKLGNYDAALEAFSKSTEIDSANPITWNNKGLTCLKSGRLVPALECFDKALEHNDKYAKAWYNKARTLSMLSRVSESQKCFDTARKLDPFLFTKLKKMKR